MNIKVIMKITQGITGELPDKKILTEMGSKTKPLPKPEYISSGKADWLN